MQRLERQEAHVAISSIVLHELRYGVARLPPGRRRDGLAAYTDDVQAKLPVLPYDSRAARWHAAERARLATIGVVHPFADGVTAAVASTNALVLVTRNVGDFARYRDLEVQSWWPTPS